MKRETCGAYDEDEEGKSSAVGRGGRGWWWLEKGRRRENSLPPPTYAAGGSYRHGLGGPWDCQTFARPSVVFGFFIRPAIDPRAILSPPTVFHNTNNRSRNKKKKKKIVYLATEELFKRVWKREENSYGEIFGHLGVAAGAPFFTTIESLTLSLRFDSPSPRYLPSKLSSICFCTQNSPSF